MDYKEMYFGLYAEVAGIIETLTDIQRKYEERFCNEDNKKDA